MNPLLDKLLSIQNGIGLCWLGNLGWLLRADDKLIATDLDLDRETRLAPSPIPTADLAPHLDVLFITHEHGDHFSGPTSKSLLANGQCRLVLPANCVDRSREFGIPADRITVAIPDSRPYGEPTRDPLVVDGIRVEPQRAFHGHTDFTVYRRANDHDCGYVFTLGGKRVYQPGDSVLLQQHMEDFADIDVLFVSPTLHNIHIEASVRFIQAVCPDHVFPQHFGSYEITEQNSYWTDGSPDEVRNALPTNLRETYHKLGQGEIFHIE